MAEIEIKKTKPLKLAYIEHVGDYGSIPFDKYINQLYGWAKAKNIRPGFQPLGIFYTPPDMTAPEQCKSEIAIPIMGDAKPESNIKIRDLPSMEVAVIKHQAPKKQYPETYRKLSEWIIKNGYEWVGPSIEIYTKKPKVLGNETIVYARIHAPVKKK